jgi:ribosomal protein S18 acetylase RimI-like enzyme
MMTVSYEGLTIRLAIAEDAASVRALTRDAYAKWVSVIGREPLPMVVDYDQAIRDHRIDLLFADEELVGVVETVDSPDHLLIVNVAVSPDHQRRGFGRYLLEHAEGLAAALGLSELRLFTNQLFAMNVDLYRRFGYVIDREEPFMGGVTVHMSKRLPRG